MTFLTDKTDPRHACTLFCWISCTGIKKAPHMGKNNHKSGNRRSFFSSLFSPQKEEKVKMLTADGKLVEVDRSVFEQLTKGKKASNQEIYRWMNNPSKEQ